jgi:hypothetical protein
MDSGRMWLGIFQRRRLFLAGDAMELARLLFYDPESEEEALYLLSKRYGATIEAIHNWRGDHLLVNGNELGFAMSIQDLEEAINEALG